MRSYRCPVCRKPLSKEEYERALGILGERGKHLHEQRAALVRHVHAAEARAKAAKQEGVESERARTRRLLAGKEKQIQVLRERIAQLRRGSTPQVEGLAFEHNLVAAPQARIAMDWIAERIAEARRLLAQLPSTAPMPEPYFEPGRTKTKADRLRQRAHQHPFMGNQKGNLRQRLVQGGRVVWHRRGQRNRQEVTFGRVFRPEPERASTAVLRLTRRPLLPANGGTHAMEAGLPRDLWVDLKTARVRVRLRPLLKAEGYLPADERNPKVVRTVLREVCEALLPKDKKNARRLLNAVMKPLSRGNLHEINVTIRLVQ